MKKFVPSWLAILVATTLLTLALARPAVASKDVTYSFTLFGPQTATNGTGTGTQTISVSGGGTFDFTAALVVASGSFQITDNSTGAVVSKGTWKATAFDSFCSRGGPSSSVQGGVLVITVTLFPVGGTPITGVTMTITCRVTNLPNNACGAGAEGVTVAGVDGFSDFTAPVRGAILFHVNQ